MTIEVSARTLKQGLDWKAGTLLMFNAKDYRVITVDPRGTDFEDRLILSIAEVT
jgi:hypothetical protein